MGQIVNFEKDHSAKDYDGIQGSNLTIDGQNAAKFVYTGPNQMEACGLGQGETLERVLVVNKNGVAYKIELRYFAKEGNLTNTLNKMVTTFKFL